MEVDLFAICQDNLLKKLACRLDTLFFSEYCQEITWVLVESTEMSLELLLHIVDVSKGGSLLLVSHLKERHKSLFREGNIDAEPFVPTDGLLLVVEHLQDQINFN